MERLSHLIRVLSAFVVFGVGGAYFSWIRLPWTWLRTPDRLTRYERCQAVIQRGFQWFLGVTSRLRVFRITWPRTEIRELPQASVIIANHPTLLDIVALMARYKKVVCFSKQGFTNPFFGGLLRASGHIPVSGNSVDAHAQVFENAIQRLEEGFSVLIFPEGTRSPPGGMHPFRRGAFEIAARAGAPIVPVVTTCTPPTLSKKLPFLKMPLQCALFSANELDPVYVKPGRQGSKAAMRAVQRQIERHLAEQDSRPQPSVQTQVRHANA